MFDLAALFSPVSRLPHGVCLTWDPTLVWTLAASHLLVGLAYFTIPVALAVFMRRQRGLRFNWMFGLFGLFIFACGATHFISLMNIWLPHYGLEAIVMAITAIVSVATAASLIPLIPIASNFIDKKARAEEQLHKMNLDLQDQMERFFDLAVAQRASQAELMTVQDASPLGQFRTDASGAVTYVNRMFERISGWPTEAVMGSAWLQIIHPQDLPRVTKDWAVAMQAEDFFASRHRMKKPDGTLVWCSVKAAPVRVDGRVLGYVGSVDDITAQHQNELALKARQAEEEARLRSLSLTDSLTGLGNRAGFEQALQGALDRRARHIRQGSAKASVAVLFADLDHFKRVNDTWGHATGDAVIQGFASRLKQGLRITDYCARMGGDEFTVVLENIHTFADATALCEKLMADIRAPLVIDGQPHSMTASFGLACHFDAAAIDAESLLKQADTLLYLAKHEGRDTYRIHPAS